MSTTPSSPAALLRHLVASDPGRPRVTVYDDTDSPTRGERIELSARVLANWVAKAANLLRDDLDAGPGTVVLLDLPPHWRTLYWAFAAWSVGACVEVPPSRTTPGAGHVASALTPDVVVTDAVDVAERAAEAVLVTLAALARSAAHRCPPGSSTRRASWPPTATSSTPGTSPTAPTRRCASAVSSTAYDGLVPAQAGGPQRVHTATGDTAAFLRLALTTFVGDGSLVVTRGAPDASMLRARLAAEGVTQGT